ncbi:M61 glycyl aminopeptidase [Ulvibacter sp. MAR_2010_11]|uniref:M61 family metallopeptidase n=1 Tax=Ulvibacter sp. MAR_2010_11 TaxID=1250229 RepID=UPI000C2BFD78|nr:hypothetical protein [Ulvibacter sp. MAR_2010_11]PKA82030.1 M61 glycyl aminopeptidase [Ulvibacter sp. MAR_2010_11]
MISSRIGGGGEHYTFNVKEKPVLVVVKGNFGIASQDIFNGVEKIVTLQRDWFGDYEYPFYRVVINERKEIIAGTAVKNQFVCFVKADIDADELNIILSHEMFHNWLPEKIKITHTADYYGTIYEWFTEGFTTYFAKKILLEAGLLSIEKYIELINKEIQNIGDSQLKNVTSAEIIATIKEGKFYSEYKKLAYWRGALIALKWEAELQNSKEKESLSGFIKALYRFAQNKGGKISEQEFHLFSEEFGIHAAADFEKYIVGGASILLPHSLPLEVSESVEIAEIDFHVFDPGFDLITTKKTSLISGVAKNGKAYNAGLRDGMKFVRSENSTRGDFGWNEDRLLKVTVKENETEAEITVAFIPLDSLVKIQQLSLKTVFTRMQ